MQTACSREGERDTRLLPASLRDSNRQFAVTGATGLYKVASSPAPDAKNGDQEGQPELGGASETLEEIEARAEELRVLGKRAKEKWLALARTKDWEQVKSRLEVYNIQARKS